MSVIFKDGQILFVSGQVAMGAACCCDCPCDNGDLPASATIAATYEYRNVSEVVRERQSWSGTLSLGVGCSYSGTINRSFEDYDGSGVLCNTRSGTVTISINWDETQCRWEANHPDGVAYITTHDPRGTWTDIPSSLSSTSFVCSPTTEDAYTNFTSFVIS